MDIRVDIFPKFKLSLNANRHMFCYIPYAAYLTRAVFMFFLENGDTGGLTTIVIITIQYTLTKSLAILGYTGF